MKIAINGFGRIGRTFFRAAWEKKLAIVAINDLGDIETLAHLLKYDSSYGRFAAEIEVKNDRLIIDSKEIVVLQEKEPANLPWRNLAVDLVIESTGVFTTHEKAMGHIKAGAKNVIITAPAKQEGEKVKTIVLGVNEAEFNP